PTKKEVIEKIFRIKKRSPKNYLPLFIKNIVMARKFAQTNRKQERFFKKVWPGRVTLVLTRKKRRDIYGIAPTTIALRVPDFKPLNLLLEKLDIPLTATSFNISGKPLSNNITMILKQFIKNQYKPDLVVDIGSLPERKPSTIIDLTKKPPKILRM
ncbi:MAG: Sua5/YciO/YrdC/YwlC family protein, partial [Candidatus Bathyarchaeota archaeon]|nr:Sua5/YciO/YrdC/YwlC family protein [Candidatus Bathyarchaeota archaeon]